MAKKLSRFYPILAGAVLLSLFAFYFISPNSQWEQSYQLWSYKTYSLSENEQTDITIRPLEPAPVTVLNFFFLPRENYTNYRTICNLSFDCIFTCDANKSKSHWTNYTAVMMFHNPAFRRFQKIIGNMNPKRDPKQIWIARGVESSVSGLNFKLMAYPNFRHLFNYTTALSPKATFRDSYFEIYKKNDPKITISRIKEEYKSFKKDKDFCWMVSQCTVYNKRFNMASELINKLPGKVHMWGSAARQCMPKLDKSKIINHGITTKKTKAYEKDMSTCKIYFAFENSNCSDYITEKFSIALANYAIPVVNGWRSSYEQQLPGSFIHVSDFDNIAKLAEYLTSLLFDEEKFFSYHKWRLNYEVVNEDEMTLYNGLNCRVCEKVFKTREANKHSMTQSDTIPNIGDEFQSLQTCVP